MSILQNIEKSHKNLIKTIKNMSNKEQKLKMIGSFALDVGNGCISAFSKIFLLSRPTIRKAIDIFKGIITYKPKVETRGRKNLTTKYPDLQEDIQKIIENHLSVDPRFKSEKQYVRLSIKEIKKQLIETGKYVDNNFSNSSLNNLVNQMGYNLKKVQKTKPLKKIKETDDIFANVHEKKEETLKEDKTVLISIDTKDKVLIGPYSRKGKNRIQINAVDHELTNDCLIPFGILDIKTNTPCFYNFKSKPTSMDMVDCIEEFWKEQYANRKYNKLSILLDNGPDNSGVRTTFLKGLIEVAKKYNITIELIYYPPYHSKYNPVERL